ncbi:36602_t:CDS:2 [Racocetra persica]|uniref:36602_t:CDS:1 n=1 Tax=Racocetra persica TaxID=160502 RepID=A0ACA9KMP4_9GLOM|nr:36602_t:CDS:2 [Racocetra persica]
MCLGWCSNVWSDFKDFVHSRGNVVDLGVGIIIGAAFTIVINSFVSDIISPPLGLVIHGSNLENYFIVLRPGKTPDATYNTPAEAQADGAVQKHEAATTETCPWCSAKIPVNSVKCQFCTSYIKEKIPPQYKRDANDNTLIDLQES